MVARTRNLLRFRCPGSESLFSWLEFGRCVATNRVVLAAAHHREAEGGEVEISSTPTGIQTFLVCLFCGAIIQNGKVFRRTPVAGGGVCGGVASPCRLPSDI